MERSSRNFKPSLSYRKFQAIFASPIRYFTENSRWVRLAVLAHKIEASNSVRNREFQLKIKQDKSKGNDKMVKEYLLVLHMSRMQSTLREILVVLCSRVALCPSFRINRYGDSTFVWRENAWPNASCEAETIKQSMYRQNGKRRYFYIRERRKY